jgi:hypothetical protein
MKARLSTFTLALGGAVVMGLGVYFVVFRPALLPEDLRYLDRSRAQLEVMAPALGAWLRHVFWVMGGYMLATGLATFYVAVTSFRTRARGAATIVVLTGAASVGGMAIVNFLIDSDFKWQLLLLALVWALALTFYRLEGTANRRQRADSLGPSRPHARPSAGPDPRSELGR